MDQNGERRDGDLDVGPRERLHDVLAVQNRSDELLFAFDDASGVAVAQVGGSEILKLGFVGLECRFAQYLTAGLARVSP